jgi:hypothetical protein
MTSSCLTASWSQWRKCPLAKTSRSEYCKLNNVRAKVAALNRLSHVYLKGSCPYGNHHRQPARCSVGCLILGSIISLGSAPSVKAQAQAPNANNSSTPSATPDAAAKAAERKKRFEEEEKRLENAESAQTESKSEPGRASDDDLSISPVLVNSLFDSAGHNLTSKAEWS